MKAFRLQSAMEYLVVYGWTIALAAIVLSLLYIFFLAPQAAVPPSCQFFLNVYCQDGVLSSNATASRLLLLLSNSQSYPILNPNITVNVSGAGLVQGSCLPHYVLPGGSVVCNATIMNRPFATGSYVNVGLVFGADNCINRMPVSQCKLNAKQYYKGVFESHVIPTYQLAPVSITLVANSNKVLTNGVGDKLIANVRLFGYALEGATVNFTSNALWASLSPAQTLSDSNGNGYSYVSGLQPGLVKVNATFINYSANTVIDFVNAFAPQTLFQYNSIVTNSSTGSAISCSFPQVHIDDMLVIGVGIGNPQSNYKIQQSSISISDSEGNPYTQIVYNSHSSHFGGTYASLWYTIIRNTGPDTVTVDYNHGPAGLFCYEILHYSTFGIQSNGNANDNTNSAYVALKTVPTNSMVISVVGTPIYPNSLFPGPGFIQVNFNSAFNASSEYEQNVTGAITPIFTTNAPTFPAWSDVATAIPP